MTLIHFVRHDTELSTFQMNIMELELLKRQLWVQSKMTPCSRPEKQYPVQQVNY